MAALLFIALFSETQIPDVPSPSCSPASQELAQQGASEATERGATPASCSGCFVTDPEFAQGRGVPDALVAAASGCTLIKAPIWRAGSILEAAAGR